MTGIENHQKHTPPVSGNIFGVMGAVIMGLAALIIIVFVDYVGKLKS